MTGYICQGFNPLMSIPDKNKVRSSLVQAEVPHHDGPARDRDRAHFFENHGEFNPIDPSQVMTEVIKLPTTCFAEDEGSLSNSSRWLQWHTPSQDRAVGNEGRHRDPRRDLHPHAGALSRKRAGPSATRSSTRTGPTSTPKARRRTRLARELNGYTLAADQGSARSDPDHCPPASSSTASAQLTGRRLDPLRLLDLFRPATRRRATSWPNGKTADPGNAGIAPGWAFAWPANRRHPLQSCLGGRERKAVGSRTASSSSGTARNGSVSTCRTMV